MGEDVLVRMRPPRYIHPNLVCIYVNYDVYVKHELSYLLEDYLRLDNNLLFLMYSDQINCHYHVSLFICVCVCVCVCVYIYMVALAQNIMALALLFGENPQTVAYSAQPLCWNG